MWRFALETRIRRRVPAPAPIRITGAAAAA
jgi:hypothetical protein